MNPTDQPPSAEAVKAAFAWIEYRQLCLNKEEFPDEDYKKRKLIRPFIMGQESHAEAAARILAAHARVRESEVARLREAIETALQHAEGEGWRSDHVVALLTGALTGEAGA